MNWIFSLFRTGFLLPVQPAKINLEIDFCRLKIQFVQLDFFNLIFQNSSTDQQGVCVLPNMLITNNLLIQPIPKGQTNQSPWVPICASLRKQSNTLSQSHNSKHVELGADCMYYTHKTIHTVAQATSSKHLLSATYLLK